MSGYPVKPKELIPTELRQFSKTDQIVVEAKVLQEFLGSGTGTRSVEWAPRRIDAGGLVKDFDFFVEDEISGAGRTVIRHYFTIDAAKHIGMMEKTEKGKEIRKYFLSLEAYLKEMDRAGWLDKFEEYKKEVNLKAIQHIESNNRMANNLISDRILQHQPAVDLRIKQFERQAAKCLALAEKGQQMYASCHCRESVRSRAQWKNLIKDDDVSKFLEVGRESKNLFPDYPDFNPQEE